MNVDSCWTKMNVGGWNTSFNHPHTPVGHCAERYIWQFLFSRTVGTSGQYWLTNQRCQQNMVMSERGMHHGIQETKRWVQISYFEVLEVKLSVEETQIFSHIKKGGEWVLGQWNMIGGTSQMRRLGCGDSRQFSVADCDAAWDQWWEKRLADRHIGR